MSANAAVVRTETGLVENIIAVDASSGSWPVPEGCELVLTTPETGPAYVNGQWNGSQFSEPPVETEPEIKPVEPEIAIDQAVIDAVAEVNAKARR